jgi:Cu/Ag efflux protein CusF
MNRIATLFALLATLTLTSTGALAQNASATGTDALLTNGEIRKIDKETGKITIKHAEIKNLDMPAMTMVFQVKDKAMLDKVKINEKIQFKASSENGKITVTEMQTEK